MHIGRFELIAGGMFAGKSTELQRQAKRQELAGRTVLFIKPKIDQRDGKGLLATHEGKSVEALEVDTEAFAIAAEDFARIQEADVICIDEVQFFDQRIITLVNFLLQHGQTVYAAGLDMDKNAIPFETTALLMAVAEDVKKLHAVCKGCGGDAWGSFETTATEGRVNIGNDYIPLCRSCVTQSLRGATASEPNTNEPTE